MSTVSTVQPLSEEEEHHSLLSTSFSPQQTFTDGSKMFTVTEEQATVPKKELKHVCDMIGDWGWWQINLVSYSISIAMFSAFNNLSSAFYAPTIPFECDQPLQIGNFSIQQCFIGNETCHSWSYNKSNFQFTAIEKFDLVCDREFLASFSQSMYMLGIVFSALIFGHCSDNYGRKPCLWAAIVIEIISGIASAYAPNITVFIIARFFTAFGCYGRNLTGFLLAVECVGLKYRAICGFAYQLGWAFGYCILPLLAYCINDFENLMITTSIPELIWLVWLYWIPESPRWQMTHDKLQDAQETIQKAAAMNGIISQNFQQDFDLLVENMEKEKPISQTKEGFLDLWKTKRLRIYTVVFYFTWFTNAFVYYGISLNIGDLSAGDLYWNFFWTGFVEFPSYFFCMYIIKYVGRRTLLCLMMFGSGISCIAFIFIPVNSPFMLIVALLGKFCITSSFGIVYVYSAEVYPTVLRQIGVGSCSVAGRAGSIIAPFIKEFTRVTSFGFSMGIFGILSLLTAVVALKLPETKGKEIPDTVEDVEKLCK